MERPVDRVQLGDFRRNLLERMQNINFRIAPGPAALTLTRFLAGIFLLLLVPGNEKSVLIFWVVMWGALSDYLDGWAARRLGKNNYPGKVMDFVADKLFISVALVTISYNLGTLNNIMALVLVGYHLLLLAGLSLISWSIDFPVVTITTGEKLAVLFSYILLVVSSGKAAFPGKRIFISLYTPVLIFAALSALTGLISYFRLLRRILNRILE